MKILYKLIFYLFLTSVLMFSKNSFASHVSGGDITYVCTGPNTYLITLKLFRDCSGTTMSTSAGITFTNSCGLNNPSLSLALQDPATGTNCVGTAVNCATEISQLCAYQMASSTCNGGSLPGMQLYTYTGTVTLPGTCNIWTVNYNLCCRNTTTNLSGQPNFHVQTTMNTASEPCNDSPVFTSQPIPYVCVNQVVNYNYGMVETQGDSMSFSLISALSNATTNVTYAGGYSAGVPIPGITINPNSGQINFTPTIIGKFVVAMKVSEFRNGILIGTVTRDIQFVVQNCANNVPNATGGDITNLTGNAIQTGPFSLELCEGNSFNFNTVYTDPDPNDTLSATTNITTVLTGATFTSSGTNPLTGTASWTAPFGSSGASYIFTVVIQDAACPVPGMQTFTYEVEVSTSTTATQDTTICGSTQLQLNASGGTVFTWYDMAGNQVPSGAAFSCNPCFNPVATPTSSISYIVISDQSGTCINTDTVNITLDVPPMPALAGPDKAFCGLTDVLAGNPASVGLGTWTQTSGPPSLSFVDPNSASTSVTAPTTGVYGITWTIENGVCTTSDSLIISFDEQPSPANAGTDKIICGQTTTLNGNTPSAGVGQWIQITGPGALSFGAPNTPGSSVSVSGTPWSYGTYTMRWTITNGVCQTSDTVQISFDQPVNPANGGQDFIICGDYIPVLGAIDEAIGTGQWTQVFGLGTATFSDTLHHNSSIIVDTYGQYIISWTVTNGSCSSADTVSLVFKEPPTDAVVGPSQEICGLSTSLIADTAYVGQGLWTKVSGPGALSFVNITGHNSIVNATEYGSYVIKWTVSNYDCSSEDSLKVTFYEAPDQANGGNDSLICNQEEFTLNAVSPVVGTGNWSVSTGPSILFDSTINNTLVIDLQTGLNEFVWTNSNGVCPVSRDTFKLILSIAEAEFESSRYFFYVDDVIQLTDLSSINPMEWTWDFGDDGSSFIQHPKHAYQDTGTFIISLLMENEHGCLDSIEKVVIVKKYLDIYAPNSFTPNGDGKNDVFQLYGDGISEMELLIFDRWGEVVFKSTDINEGWNGRKNNGNGKASSGVHVYKLRVIDYHGIEKKQEGTITIIK